MTGRALADLLAVPFHDVDEAIVAATGRSIADIFVDDGEPAFRDLERAEVARALGRRAGGGVAGRGCAHRPATREQLGEHVVVFLDVGIADAAKRIGFDQSRPLLSVNPRASWVAMMARGGRSTSRWRRTGSTRQAARPRRSRRRSRPAPAPTEAAEGDVTTVRVGGDGGYDVLVGTACSPGCPACSGRRCVRVLLVRAADALARRAVAGVSSGRRRRGPRG